MGPHLRPPMLETLGKDSSFWISGSPPGDFNVLTLETHGIKAYRVRSYELGWCTLTYNRSILFSFPYKYGKLMNSEIWDHTMDTEDFIYWFLNMPGNKESLLGVPDPERELTCVMLRTVVTLLRGSVRNAGKDGTSLVLSLLGKH